MTEISMENSKDPFMEIDIGSCTESFQKFLETQKELFHSQVDQLQKIVVTQCKLTSVNPLAQEMAAGALSIKIGKKPRDLLNPKAVKYMQAVFSIKDMISKKETREISAHCGVTVTQVREFFAGQRSRVRKLVRLSKQKGVAWPKSSQSDLLNRSDSAMPLDQVPLNSVDSAMPLDQVPLNSVDSAMPIDQVPLNSVDSKIVGGISSSLEEALRNMDSSDKNFLENIFNLMRKEETFAGQVKLMDWILQIQNPSVLYWFLTKDGVMILTSWLSQAAVEEQTSVLLVIFKVLCHLPLHKALPNHMSAILQTVNRLRFYSSSDISNRARVLLTKWSKVFVRSQALKRPTCIKVPNAAQNTTQKQRIGEFFSDEAWQSKVDIPEEILALTYADSENSRKLDPPQTLKLLPASADDSNKRNIRSGPSQTRERRKVVLVEQPGEKTSSRSKQVTSSVPAKRSRPMSVDDIQKAKRRALFMQSKNGEIVSSSSGVSGQKTEHPVKPCTSNGGNLPSASSKVPHRSKTEEDATNSSTHASTSSSSKVEDPIRAKESSNHQKSSQEKFNMDRLSWKIPPVVRINNLWRIGTGEKSKEVEIQVNRIKRERETFYHRNQEIPPNPKEPWDFEIDYDDTLTPVIPIEQPLDADVITESSAFPTDNGSSRDITSTANTQECCPPPAPTSSTGCAAEPDFELLAVLLKNPQLVFALTSGQGGNLTGMDTVKLLDMIKNSGLGLTQSLSGLCGKAEEKVEVTSLPSPTPSLPSPTPGSDHVMNGWRSEAGNGRFLQATSAMYSDVPATCTIPSLGKLPLTASMQTQIPSTSFSSSQNPMVANPAPQQLQQALQLLSQQQVNTGAGFPGKIAVSPSLGQQSHVGPRLQSPSMHFTLNSESAEFRQMQNVKPAPVSIVINPPKERPPIALHHLPPLLPNPQRPRLSPNPNPPSFAASRNVVQFSATNLHYQANHDNINAFAQGLVPPTSYGPRRNGYVGEPELETWSPERSPERFPSYQPRLNFQEPRNAYGWNSRPEQSRQRNSGYRERGGRHEKSWRERRH